MLRHYLVLRSEGVPLYTFTNKLSDPHYTGERSTTEKSIVDNSTLFSGLLSSFVSFGKELGGSLQQIKLDNADLYMYEQNSLIGVTVADPSIDPEEIQSYHKTTQLVTDHFISTFKHDLDHWDGNITKFEAFTSTIQQSSLVGDRIDPDKLCTSCLLECCTPVTQELE